MSTFTFKIATLYAAYSPELGVVSYGGCQDEALNNLIDELAERQSKTGHWGSQIVTSNAAPKMPSNRHA